MVFARGTNDAPGIGNVGGAFVDDPATFAFLGAADGANDASAHIQYMVGSCPNSRLVLGRPPNWAFR